MKQDMPLSNMQQAGSSIGLKNGYSKQDDSKQGLEPQADGVRWASAIKMFTKIEELVEHGI
jgi:hypothetical protein